MPDRYPTSSWSSACSPNSDRHILRCGHSRDKEDFSGTRGATLSADGRAQRGVRARLTLASCVSAAMILADPLMGQIRAELRFAFPRQFVTIVGGFVTVAIVIAILLALTIILGVLLDLIAVGCGLLVAWALQPPEALMRRLRHTSVSKVGVAAAAALLVFAAFFSTVHLGYLLADSEIGSFRSRYSVERLHALERYPRAWNENLILENFFAPVLDTPSYATPRGSRWPPDQRADAERRIEGKVAPFLSNAEPLPILTWSKRIFWLVTGTRSKAVAAAGGYFAAAGRSRPTVSAASLFIHSLARWLATVFSSASNFT
jgi:hypothetical protein